MQYAFFDIHSHLHDKAFDDDREAVIDQMKTHGVGTIIVGTDIHESEEALALAETYDHIYATVGLHPADNVFEIFNKEAYEALARNKKVVAIGECGLDYHYIKTFFKRDQEEKGVTWNEEEEKERQENIFKAQIELSVKLEKPLMLHGRPSKGSMDAYEDMLDILEEAKANYGEKLSGNAHFFVGDIDIATRFIDIGFTMSFSGVITFTHEYDDVVRYVPLHMMHAETDSPYATPAPFRGQRNSSLFVQEIVAKIAVLREQPMEEVREQLLENARRVFGV